MQKQVGLAGATATVVGFVIGTSIFVLPAQLAGSAGPAVVVSYGIACCIALLLCIVTAELGCRLPVNGGSFVVVAQHVGEIPAFLLMWTMILSVAIGMAAVAVGVANYLADVVPAVPPKVIALVFVVIFIVLNLIGLRAAIWTQALLTGAFLVAKGLFLATAWIPFQSERLVPFLPNGVVAMLAAIVPAYFSFGGFSVLLEIGGEVRNPRRNVPLAIGLSFLMVLGMYIAVPLLLVGGLPWKALPNLPAPALTLIEPVAPAWLSAIVRIGILGGAITAINAVLLGYSRNLAAIAAAGFLPGVLARTGRRRGQPYAAILAIGTVTVLSIAVGASITQYAVIFVVAFLAQHVLLGLALLSIIGTAEPAVFPDWLSRPVALVLIGVSVLLLAAALWSDPSMFIVTTVVALLGTLVYVVRRFRGRAVGRDWLPGDRDRHHAGKSTAK